MKYAGVVLAGGAVFGLAACGGQAPAESASASQSASTSESASTSASSAASASEAASSSASAAAATSAAVVFYSRVGENYQVGVIEEGNTAKVAKEIAAQTGAELIEVKPANTYPDGYDECCDVALAEQDEGARPELESIPDLAAYDTIYLGYPIWWGDLPMFMYTLLENGDFAGKTIYPFCTHEGSGLSGTPANIAETCPDATVGEGMDLRGKTAQESPDEVKSAVADWLASL
jgi:flavodoxin